MLLIVVIFLIPVPQAAPLNPRPVELKLSRLIDPKASLSVTSVQVAVEDSYNPPADGAARRQFLQPPRQR